MFPCCRNLNTLHLYHLAPLGHHAPYTMILWQDEDRINTWARWIVRLSISKRYKKSVTPIISFLANVIIQWNVRSSTTTINGNLTELVLIPFNPVIIMHCTVMSDDMYVCLERPNDCENLSHVVRQFFLRDGT